MTSVPTPEIEPVEAAVTAFLVDGVMSAEDGALLQAHDLEDLQTRISTVAEKLGTEDDPERYANRIKLLGSAAAGSTHLWQYIARKPELNIRGDFNVGAPGGGLVSGLRINGRRTRPHSNQNG